MSLQRNDRLYIPINVRTDTEFVKGFGTKELSKAVLLTLLLSAIVIPVAAFLKMPPIGFIGVIVSGMFSVGVYTKDESNQSIASRASLLIRFIRSQKKLPYRQLSEWGVLMKTSPSLPDTVSESKKPKPGFSFFPAFKPDEPQPAPEVVTAQQFVNVRDIDEDVLYTRDGYAIIYIRVQPVSIELMLGRERDELISALTSKMGDIPEWRFYAIGRPIDISEPINRLAEERANTIDAKRKQILGRMIRDLSAYAMSSDVIERQFYFMIWSTASEMDVKELKTRAKDLVERLGSVSTPIHGYIAKRSEIAQLCNLFANPNQATTEYADDWDATIPLLAGNMGREF